MTSRNYVGGNHNFASANAWSPTGAPEPGDGLSITSGTVTASNLTIQDVGITLLSGDPVLVLQNATLDAASAVRSSGEDRYHPPVIDTKGKVTNAGLIENDHNNLDINVGSASVFTNSGMISAPQGMGPTEIDISGGTLHNSGTIISTGNGTTPGGTIDLSGSISNSGLIQTIGGVINIAPTGAMINSGVLSATNSGRLSGHNYAPTMNIQLSNTLTNTGMIINNADMNITGSTVKNSGTIRNINTLTLDTKVSQTASGVILQTAGDIVVDQAVTGGTVNILNGMIEFGGAKGPNFIGTESSREFTAALEFSPSGSLKFDNVSNLVASLQPTNVLDVYAAPTAPGGHYTQIAALHLTGGTYTQSEFTTSGNIIKFVQS